MPSIAAFTIYVFGITAFVTGIWTLLHPTDMAAQLQLPDGFLGTIYGTGLASLAMGIYYSLAAWQNNQAFFILSVPMRLLTTAVFWNVGGPFKPVAIWEGSFATATAGALALGV